MAIDFNSMAVQPIIKQLMTNVETSFAKMMVASSLVAAFIATASMQAFVIVMFTTRSAISCFGWAGSWGVWCITGQGQVLGQVGLTAGAIGIRGCQVAWPGQSDYNLASTAPTQAFVTTPIIITMSYLSTKQQLKMITASTAAIAAQPTAEVASDAATGSPFNLQLQRVQVQSLEAVAQESARNDSFTMAECSMAYRQEQKSDGRLV